MFYLVLSGFLVGIGLRSLTEVPVFFIVSLGIASVVAVLCAFKDRRCAYVALVLASVAFGIIRFEIADQPPVVIPPEIEITKEVSVVNEADVRENSTRLLVELSEGSRAVIITEHYPEYKYGDRLQIIGEFEKPENFETDSGREFDYVNYLAKDNVHYIIPFPDIEILVRGEGNVFKEKLFSLKSAFIEKMQAVIPEPESSLSGGLLLGARRSLGSDLEKDFRTTGIVHIVVLSGYNVTIVAESIIATLSFLPRMVGGVVGILSIIGFAVITGAGATIVRASIMACLVVVARLAYRDYDIVRALVLAGAIMVLHNPKILLFDISFQLSFLATLGLIVLSPRLEKYFIWVPKKFGLREVFTATISTQIFVLPLLLYSVGELSIVALPVNLLVLATVPSAMLFSFLTGLFGFISIALAFIPGFVAHIILSYELWIVDIFARVPLASVVVPQFPFWVVIGVYILYGMLFLRIKKTAPTDVGAVEE